jgi:type III pantothenate kinase
MPATVSAPFLVADIGNTRIKWGWCSSEAVTKATALPDDPDAWREQITAWRIEAPSTWVLAGVHPERRDRLAEWLSSRGHQVRVIRHFTQIPLEVRVERPDQVGIDRLLDVLAARSEVPRGEPAVVVDAGSAVTVNWMDAEGVFAGGAIFPGRRLMAEALHNYTATLPRADLEKHAPMVPAGNTQQALAAGIHWAVVGGIRSLIEQLQLVQPTDRPIRVFVTGGDAPQLIPDLRAADYDVRHRPWLTLEGIRMTAEHG